MPFFRYKARHRQTQALSKGTIEAKDANDAIVKLRTRDLLILSIQLDVPVNLPFTSRIKSLDRILFTRELAVMTKAGLPIMQSLTTIANQTSNRSLKQTILGIIALLQDGSSLSDALAKYPHHFPPVFVSVARTGERSGKLDEVLNRLADQLEKDSDLVSKTKGALIYPAFVLIALIAVVILIVVYIIPQLRSIFEESGVALPLITQLMLNMSDSARSYGLVWLAILATLIIAAKLSMRVPAVRLFIEKIYFKVPVFGSLYRKILMTRFSHTLATLVGSGLPLLEAIQTTRNALNSPSYQIILEELSKDVENGKSFSQALLEQKAFPPMIGSMVSIGESSGSIDVGLETVAGFFDREIEASTRNLSALLEPFLMLLMGLGVALVVAAVIVPIYNLVNAI